MRSFWQSRWRDSLIIIPPLLIAAWFAYGFVFSYKLFDSHFSHFALLDDLEVIFGYVGVLFAVQIPVFILLLEKMHGAGYVRRIVLPSVISFREILVSYVVLSLLLLVAPRAAYFYFPVIALTLMSLYTLVEAVRVMFEARKLKEREDTYITKLVESALGASLKGRISINNFFATIKKFPFISHALLDMGSSHSENDRHYPIRIARAGIVTFVDVKRLSDLMANEYHGNISKVNSGKAKDGSGSVKNARLVLHTRPSAKVKKQDDVLRLILADTLDAPSQRFTNILLDCIKITHDHPDSADRQMDDLIKDFKQQLREAIDRDDEVMTDDALGIYELLTDGLATLHFNDDSGYDLETARGEFNQFFSDSVSDRLRLIADVIDDEFFYALRTEKQEAVESLVSNMYKSTLRVTSSFDVLTVARAERAFTHALSRLVYSDEATLRNQEYREHVLGLITTRLKEHTGLLLYNYREYNNSMSFTKKQLIQWIETRLGDMLGFMLGAYKKSQASMFKDIKSVFDVIEEDYDLYHERVEEFIWHSRCRLFMIAAYIQGKTDRTELQEDMKVIMDKFFSGFSAKDLTRIMVECIDNDYADKWRLDTHDLVADGRMHSVPDFDINLKSLWVEYMLALGDLPTDVRYYDESLIAKTGAFSDLMTDSERAFIPRHLDELEKAGRDVKGLRAVVDSFIKERKEWENGALAAADLDKEMVATFKDEVLRSYRESALALSVFKKAGRLKLLRGATKDFLSFGWNQIQDKYGFIKNWHIGVGHQTHEYGNQIARAENRHILDTLLAKPNTKIDDFETWIKKLRRQKSKTWFIISVRVADWYITFHRKDDMGKHVIENHSRGEMNFKSLDQVAPIFYTYEKQAPKGLYAIPVEDIGIVEIKGSDDEPVKVSIDAYSHDEKLLRAITKSPPDWLKEKGDPSEQEAFLKTKVRVFIQHPFKYIPVKNPTIYYYPVDDKDSD